MAVCKVSNILLSVPCIDCDNTCTLQFNSCEKEVFEIKNMQTKIAELSNKKSQSSIEISAEKDKIAQTQGKFIGAYNVLKQELLDEKTKIQTYGKI